MILDVLKTAITQNIGQLKPAPKGWQKANCRLCAARGHGRDTRQRFGIQFNPNSIATHCFNCGFSSGYTEGEVLSSSFKFFLRHLNIDEKFIQQIEFEVFKQKNKIRALHEGDENFDLESKVNAMFKRWQPVKLPDDALPITTWLEYGLDDDNFLNVVNYAMSRKIYNLDRFYWSPAKYHQVNQRLIIPYFHKNEIVGFTARLYFDTPDKSIPKYYQQCPSDFVYNLDPQQPWERKYVIVTEGVLDAWVTDGVATLGEIGQEKIDIINRLGKEVIVCPDRDKKGGDLVKVAMSNDWKVAFPRWHPGIKDAARASEKYGKLLTLQSIIDTAIEGNDKIQIKWKLEQNARQRQRQ